MSRDKGADEGDASRKALVTGSVAAGALLASFLVRRLRKRTSVAAPDLPHALDASVKDMEIMEGRYRFYTREGRGVPIVLLHSINAAASSFEMKPIFDALCASTHRPVYALDWFGFGISDRPPVEYTADLFQRQLRRFLSEQIHQPADVIAYSLGSEFAAITAVNHPFLFRRLVLIAPTALDEDGDRSAVRKLLIDASARSGIFEIAFTRLTRPGALRLFYERQIFGDGNQVPEVLVDYAFKTSSARGASNAPAAFISGQLFSGDAATEAYRQLAVPTLMIVPRAASSDLQSFEMASTVRDDNPKIDLETIESGLMPQWEAPEHMANMILAFIGTD
jgi:pimeloyl-ACP methyl ester carboxylesterase